MTYCVGVMLESGLIFASNSRPHTYPHTDANNLASFCKLSLFERTNDRVIVLLSSGNPDAIQAVISILKQNQARPTLSLWNAESLFDIVLLVSEAMRLVDKRNGQHLAKSAAGFNVSFILGGQIGEEPPRLFRIYAEGHFTEAGKQTPYFQTGASKYGKPINNKAIKRSTTLSDATKYILASFESTTPGKVSVGMSIDLICYQPDSLAVTMRRRFDSNDRYFTELGNEWNSAGSHRQDQQNIDC